MKPKTVLFLCTGNYYRSRFAEALFNHLARERCLDWKADSRALALERGKGVNIGPISAHALLGLKELSIPTEGLTRYPMQATTADFASSELVIALKEAEHRPLMRERFPEWENRITYWHIHDLDVVPHTEALPEIEARVRELVAGLAQREAR